MILCMNQYIRVIRGARFFHLCSKFDKGTAMVITMNKFKKIYELIIDKGNIIRLRARSSVGVH